ncbi:MAG: hypothetical protein OEY52_00080 [Gammaproteobacteria bacterium]|nr:hypothetical protein [Gammaproteobacteria bacterium]
MMYVNRFNKTFGTINIVVILATLIFLLSACSTTASKDDPLKNSRKLIKQGHASLYNNGAFKVPFTKIKLIPAGHSATQLALDMMGLHARQSLLKSLKNAADSIYIIPAGSKLSLDYAKRIQRGGRKAGKGVTDTTRPLGKLIIKRSLTKGKDLSLNSWRFGKKTAAALYQYGADIASGSKNIGNSLANHMTDTGSVTLKKSWHTAKKISNKTNTSVTKNLRYAGNTFVKGYVALPDKLSKRTNNIIEAAKPDNFTRGVVKANYHRKKFSNIMTNLVVDGTSKYTSDVKSAFVKAGDSFKHSIGVTGFGLAFLKSTRWVLQGVLWDGLVKPISKIGAGSIGYLAVNLAAFPAMVVVNEGIAITNLAIEVSWNTAGATYDLIAPSTKAAVASIYSLFQFSVGHTLAGSSGLGMAAFGSGSIITGQVVGNTIKGVGYIAGKSVQYIGVPITAAGVTLGSGTVGVVAGGAGVVTGSTVMVGGEVASLTTNAFGNILAGTTLVAGTTASVAAGVAVGAYEVTKAVVVPVSYELGGGIVLGYTSVSQLAAHSVLAVADASYLVLSLEGPRWVIYAVKGELGNGDDLPPGTLLDLEAMQDQGETFYNLPVSDQEMNAVVENIYQELPVEPEPASDEE